MEKYKASIEFDFSNCTEQQAHRIKLFLELAAGNMNGQINVLTTAKMVAPLVKITDLKTGQEIDDMIAPETIATKNIVVMDNRQLGSGEINIKLSESIITVRHFDGNVLLVKQAVHGDWNKIWETLGSLGE